MTNPLEYHISVRHSLSASVLALSLVFGPGFLMETSHAQINGAPASVTSQAIWWTLDQRNAIERYVVRPTRIFTATFRRYLLILIKVASAKPARSASSPASLFAV